MNDPRLGHLAGFTLAGLLLNHAVIAAPLLRCHVTYAGNTQTLDREAVSPCWNQRENAVRLCRGTD